MTLLEEVGEESVKVIFPLGKIDAVRKDQLNLPIIDTKYYEKLKLENTSQVS